jgi:hypothetical protein
MRDDTTDPRLSRWLAAEAGREERAAETALAELFAALPRASAPAGFADRVMARVAAEGALAPAWPLERIALILLAASGISLGFLPRWLPRVWDHLAPESFVGALASLLVHVAHAVAALAPLWEGLVRVARWLALAAGSPQVLVAVALSTLLAAMAGRLLLGLVDERSSGHAQVG